MAGKRRSKSKRPKPAPRSAPPVARPASKWRWAGFLGFVVIAIASVWLLVAFPSARGPGSGRDVELDLPGGESTDVLIGRLTSAGLTDSPRLFALYVRVLGGTGRVVPGVHLLTDDLSPRELMARLERGSGAGQARVTIPEGWTVFDIAKRLQAMHVCTLRGFLDAVRNPALLTEIQVSGESAEGFLFPATYSLAPDSDPADVIRRMKSEFDKRFAALSDRRPLGVLDLSSSLGWGTREIITLASMVEKEAVVDEERPIIASVFLNRLRDPVFAATSGKYLQCDPTAGYGCLVHPELAPSCASYVGKITHDVVADARNPYNTYKHEGLPPGPIANPGAKSIDAVLSPVTTHYFYFVARGEGRHTFSETYSAHNAAVQSAKAASRGASP